MAQRIYERDLIQWEQGVLDVMVEEGRAQYVPEVGYVVQQYEGGQVVVRFAQILADAVLREQAEEFDQQQAEIDAIDMDELDDFVQKMVAEKAEREAAKSVDKMDDDDLLAYFTRKVS